MRTLPSGRYIDREWFELERDHVFHRTWQCVGRAEKVATPGSYFALDLSGEPLVIVRDLQGTLRGFFNVCRHRAGPVAEGEGNRQNLQCAYHGWTYHMDGRLHRAPEMEDNERFDPSEVCLPSIRVGVWGGFVFVNLDDSAPALEETFDAIDEGLASGLALVERREYVVEANWKVYIDNFLEGYHLPMVHPTLFQLVDYDRYRVETHAHHSEQIAPLRSGADENARHYWVFPNLMLNFYPGSMQVNFVVPRGVTRTLTIFEWYAAGGELTDRVRDSIELGEKVQREDMAICESVQKGLQSRSYDIGTFSARRENGVHHFQRLLLDYTRQKAQPLGESTL